MWSLWVGRVLSYLIYLYCRAKWWSAKDWNLAKIWSYGRWNVRGRGRKWTHTWNGIWSLYLNSIFFPTLLGEWNFFLLLSFSSFIIFLGKIAPLSLADMILKSLEFRDGKTSMRWMGTLWRFWVCVCRETVSDEGVCQYPEWIIDGPDIFFRLANNGYTKEKDQQMASSIP